mgnify:FL=1|tara:strand:- start:34 stop:564 length:531 start_codon:yes stop_codon:yes gene_type:complete
MVGVYTITNRINGNMYVGSSNDVDKRMGNHTSRLRNNNHYNAKLQNAVNKYKLSNFDFELLVECELEHQFSTESYWYNLLSPKYNLVDVKPNGGRCWSKADREDKRLKTKGRIRVMCTPSGSYDPRECYLFESISQTVDIMFPEIKKIKACFSVSSVLKGHMLHYKGWHFKVWDND